MINYDSILTAIDSTVINTSEEYRLGEGAPDIGIGLSERAYVVSSDDWIIGLLVVMGVLLATILYKGRRLLAHHLEDFFSTKQRINAEPIRDNASEVGGVLLLATVSALSLSVVCFNDLADVCQLNPVLDIPYWVLAFGFVLFVCFVYAKAWLYALVNWVFFDHESRRTWMVRYFFITSLTAFCFYPLAVIDVLVPAEKDVATWGVILIWFLYEILLFYRLSTNFNAKRYTYVLIFMYFCTVEVVPALILWKGMGWLTDAFIVKHIIF